MIYELREYRIKKGKMKQWLKFFEGEIVPFQVAQGMVVAGSFTAIKEADLFVWLRRFRSEGERLRLYKKVYESDHWQKRIEPKIGGLLNTSATVVTQLSPTPKSVLQ